MSFISSMLDSFENYMTDRGFEKGITALIVGMLAIIIGQYVNAFFTVLSRDLIANPSFLKGMNMALRGFLLSYLPVTILFIMGLYLWFAEPNGYARFMGLLILIFYVVPLLAPWFPFSDAKYAIDHFKINPTICYLILFLVGGYIFEIFYNEINDRIHISSQGGVISRILVSVDSFLSGAGLEKGTIAFIIGMFFIYFTSIVHEMGHVLVASYLGCKAAIVKDLGFIAASAINCPATTSNLHWILICYAGPMFAFLLGLLLWFAEPNGYARLGGLIAFLYSCLPNIAPWIPQSDAMVAVTKYHMPLSASFLIFILIGGYIMYNVYQEIHDRLGGVNAKKH